MTREDAKERICDMLEEATSGSEAVCYVTSYDEKALKMAIKALEQEPCEDTISRQAAVDAIYHHLPSVSRTRARTMLHEVPSAQPERKTGHWIKTARWGRVYYCDQCRNYLDFDGVNAGRGSTNFCPNCGAKMRGEQDE